MASGDGKTATAGSGGDLGAALAAFNSGVAASREIAAQDKRVAAAERKRAEAAETVRRVRASDHTPEDLAAAEAGYRSALEEWRLTVGGESGDPALPDELDDAGGPEAPAESPPSDESST